MPNAYTWFKTSSGQDSAYRMAQNRSLHATGPNRSPKGNNSKKQEDDKKNFIVGKTLIGGQEVVG